MLVAFLRLRHAIEPFFDVRAFREDMPQFGDLEWLLRCGFSGKEIAYLPRTLMTYRCHTGNVSSTSFATNRDIKESLLIYQLYHTDPRISAGCRSFLKSQLKNVLRRLGVAAVRLQSTRLRSAVAVTGEILAALLNRPARCIDAFSKQ